MLSLLVEFSHDSGKKAEWRLFTIYIRGFQHSLSAKARVKYRNLVIEFCHQYHHKLADVSIWPNDTFDPVDEGRNSCVNAG